MGSNRNLLAAEGRMDGGTHSRAGRKFCLHEGGTYFITVLFSTFDIDIAQRRDAAPSLRGSAEPSSRRAWVGWQPRGGITTLCVHECAADWSALTQPSVHVAPGARPHAACRGGLRAEFRSGGGCDADGDGALRRGSWLRTASRPPSRRELPPRGSASAGRNGDTLDA